MLHISEHLRRHDIVYAKHCEHETPTPALDCQHIDSFPCFTFAAFKNAGLLCKSSHLGLRIQPTMRQAMQAGGQWAMPQQNAPREQSGLPQSAASLIALLTSRDAAVFYTIHCTVVKHCPLVSVPAIRVQVRYEDHPRLEDQFHHLRSGHHSS